MAAPDLPTTFGKYRVLDRIAVGGMAEIYKARLEGIGGFSRTYAIKVIRPELSSRPEFVEMLLDEARIAGLLSHANIVQIADLGQIDQTWYIAMELVEGADLGKVLKRCKERGGPMPLAHALYVVGEVLKALDYAHTRTVLREGRLVPLSIVHRDVTPPNVLLSHQGEVKLTDFGIARASVKVMETVSGVIKGRFDYLSPEQAAGTPLDPRSDLFTVGVLLYEMVTGTHPFRRKREVDTVQAIRTADHRRAAALVPSLPPEVDALIEKALSLRATDRFPSAAAMREALDRHLHGTRQVASSTAFSGWLRGLLTDLVPGDPKALADAETRPRPIPGTENADRPTQLAPPPVATDTSLARLDTTVRRRPPLDPALLRGMPLPGALPSSALPAVGPVVAPPPAVPPPPPAPPDEETFIRPGLRVLDPAASLDAPGEWGDAPTRIRAPAPSAAPNLAAPSAVAPAPAPKPPPPAPKPAPQAAAAPPPAPRIAAPAVPPRPAARPAPPPPPIDDDSDELELELDGPEADEGLPTAPTRPGPRPADPPTHLEPAERLPSPAAVRPAAAPTDPPTRFEANAPRARAQRTANAADPPTHFERMGPSAAAPPAPQPPPAPPPAPPPRVSRLDTAPPPPRPAAPPLADARAPEAAAPPPRRPHPALVDDDNTPPPTAAPPLWAMALLGLGLAGFGMAAGAAIGTLAARRAPTRLSVVAPAGTAVGLDGAAPAAGALSFPVSAGPHTVTVVLPGRRPVQHAVNVDGGTEKVLVVDAASAASESP